MALFSEDNIVASLTDRIMAKLTDAVLWVPVYENSDDTPEMVARQRHQIAEDLRHEIRQAIAPNLDAIDEAHDRVNDKLTIILNLVREQSETIASIEAALPGVKL